MSCYVEIDSLSLDIRKKLLQDLTIHPKRTIYGSKPSFDIYDIINDDYVTVPFAYFFHHINKGYPNDNYTYSPMTVPFEAKLLDRQKSVREETLEILNETRSVILSFHCGFGKSIYALYLACKIKLKVGIVCNRIVLLDQWSHYIKRVCPSAKVQIVETKTKMENDTDFYIFNVVNISKRNHDDYKDIGLLIIDEVHTIATEINSYSLTFFQPKYLIGLSATPMRSDNMDIILELYFGPNIIFRKLHCLFNVYLIRTNFTPKCETNSIGRLDWNSVLSSQALDKKRNCLIVDLVRYFSTRSILILCKRKDQAYILQKALAKYGEDVDIYVGSQRWVNYDCRVLIATTSKIGLGFDNAKLDMIITASDIEEMFIQYLGRMFRREHHFPIYLNLMDKFRPLTKHSDTRLDVCKEIGAETKLFDNYFPYFNYFRNKFFQTDLDDVYEKLNISIFPHGKRKNDI